MTVEEVCRALGCVRSHVSHLVARGRLRPHLVDRIERHKGVRRKVTRYVFSPLDVHAYAEARRGPRHSADCECVSCVPEGLKVDVHVKLTPDQLADVAAEAAERGVSRGEIVRQAVAEHLELRRQAE